MTLVRPVQTVGRDTSGRPLKKRVNNGAWPCRFSPVFLVLLYRHAKKPVTKATPPWGKRQLCKPDRENCGQVSLLGRMGNLSSVAEGATPKVAEVSATGESSTG